MTSQRANSSVFYDEEECLGFGVFVAELELIIGTSRDRRPDQIQLLELLQKLEASISTTESSTLKQHQKRCEAALYDIIYKGACTVVRNLVASCLSKLYTLGDLLPLYSRVNILQTFLQDKNVTAAEVVRLGVLDVLSHLTRNLGKYLASSTVESMAIATKAADKSNSSRMRAAGFRLAAHAVEALPYLDRNTAAMQAEAWKIMEKQVKDKSSDELRAAGVALLSAICRAGGSHLWSSAGYYAEEAVKLAIAGLGDAASQATREAFALALADLAVAARPSNPALAAALDAEKKPAKRQQLEKLAGGMFKAALVQPFVDAAVEEDKDVLTALALAWSSYGSSLSSSGPDSPEVLVDLAVKAVEMLELASKAADAVVKGQSQDPPNINIGACLAGGEMPAASAAVIYFIRASVIRHLAEPGQRKLLAALARATSHAIAPPVIIAALEGCGVLLEILGEVHDEATIKAVENAAMSKLSASSSAVRHQAAAVLAALALSSPPLLAQLFGDCLEGVETYCQQLMLLAAPYTKSRGPPLASSAGGSYPSSPGTPRGAPDSQTKHCIDGLHGNALAVGALLVASARSALGAPSRLTRSVFWIAKRMISQPYCSCPWAVAAEREAGYILLGSMCAAAAPELLTGHQKQQQILELFKIALGTSAADALAGASDATAGDAGLELAVACWWRAAALQALSAYVLGVMGKGYAEDPAQQVRLIASMLAPLLDIINSNTSLADPVAAALSPATAAAHSAASHATASSTHPSPRASSAGSATASSATPSGTAAAAASANGSAATAASVSSPVATAAVALLQMRLLEVFFFLPGAQFWSQCHGPLLSLSCRQLMGLGGSRVLPEYAAAVANSSLKHMLNSQDALLGPWLPGRDMLEDELRTFVGEPGGPQQHPWEVGAAFTEGFITYSQALLPAVDSEAAAAAAATATAAAVVAAGGGSSATTAAAAAFADAAIGNVGGAVGVSELGLLGSQEPQRRGADGVRLRRRFMPYPQPYALGPALLEAQLWLLGKLLAVVTPATQLQMLEVMLNAVSVKSFASMTAASGRAASNEQRAANCTAIALAGLAGLGSLAKRARGDAVSDKLAERVLQLASCMLEDQVSNACLARAGAEMMAAATAIGSSALASSQVKAITVQLSAMMADAGQASSGASASGATAEAAGAGSSPELRAVLCLVLGSIYRVKGGVPLQSMMRAAVEALVAVASRPVGVAHIWALHGLWLVAGAAGPGYAAHVKQSLQLALELLVSSFGDNPLLQPAAARLANAMIAVLGPEFRLGSAAYSQCKALVTANTGGASRRAAPAAADSTGSGSSGSIAAEGLQGLAATWAELEQVLYAQQLILFAPEAVPAAKHLPLLLLTLTSSRPALRRAAAATLKHLAERNPKGLAEVCIEASLLAALDGESEPTASAQLRQTLTALLVTTAPQKPGYWIRLLGSVALATSAPMTAVAVGQGIAAAVPGAPASQADTVDEDDDADRPVTAAASPSPVPPSPSSTTPSNPATAAVAAAAAGLPPTPRLRTRLFASELLLSLFVAVGSDMRHRFPKPKYDAGDAVAAGGLNGSSESNEAEETDFLVTHLQTLIDLSYKLTTSSAESLRPFGAQLLQHTIRFFETVADPDVPDMLLLEQYQAQFVAALRAALAPGAAPALAVCGGNLAIAFLSAGLAAGDGAVMRRLMDLLVAPLDAWQGLVYGGYAESVGVRARVALLQAHAQCANLASAFSSNGGSNSSRSLGGVGSYSSSGSSRGFVGLCISPSSSNNELCRSIVVKSQAAHKDMLLLLWWGVLLDYIAFRSSLPGFLQNHKSLLFGDVYPEVVDAVQGTYASAWPPVLIALASNLPPAADLAATKSTPAAAAAAAAAGTDGRSFKDQQRQTSWSAFVDQVSSGAGFAAATRTGGSSNGSGVRLSSGGQSWGAMFTQQLKLQCCAMYVMLVDVSSLLLCDAAAAAAAGWSETYETGSGSAASIQDLSSQPQQQWQQQLPPGAIVAAQRAAVALQALHLLLTKQHLESGLVTASVCVEVAGRLSALAVEVLLPWRRQQQEQANAGMLATGPPAAAAATDKVLGLVLVAAADLVDALAGGLPYLQSAVQQQQQHEQQSDIVSKVRSAVLEAILALSSIAVPYEEIEVSSSSRPTGKVAYLPALVTSQLRQQQQQQQGPLDCSNSTGSSLVSQPAGPQAVAACSSLCRASICIIQQQQQQQQAGSLSSGSLLTRVTGLSVRLLLTAAPGDQLTSAQQLLDSCCIAAAAAGQQQLKVVAAVASSCQTLCQAISNAVAQVCNSSSSSSSSSDGHWGQVVDAAARLPALLSSSLSAAACCSSFWLNDTAAVPAAVGGACASLPNGADDPVQQCCAVLLMSLQQYKPQQQQQQRQVQNLTTAEGGAAVVAAKVLEAIRLLLQDPAAGQQQQQQLQQGRSKLSQLITAAVVPQVAVLIHESMNCGRGPLTGAELAVVTEGLKVLLLLANKTAAQGEAAQVAVMSVLVPLLIEVAKPPPTTPVTPLLRDMACKLVSAMPTSAAAAAFKTAVVALPAASKQRLQLALKEHAAATAATATAPIAGRDAAAAAVGAVGLTPSAEAKKPAIQLKMNFALPASK